MTTKTTITGLTENVINANKQVLSMQETIKYISYFMVFSIIFAIMFVSFDVLAATDVFAKVNTKGTEIITGIRNIAVVIATIAIMIVSIMMYKGRIGNQMAFGIIIGSIILGAATEIAELLIN